MIKHIDHIMMQTAELFSALSKCNRKKVGAVLSYNGRILACGYNGTIPGSDNNCEDEFGKTSDFVLHAEQNILTYCNRHGIKTNNCDIYITLSPCANCAKLLASAGIKNIYYRERYRDIKPLEFLKDLKINLIRI